MGSLFGTDGIRGVVGVEPMTRETVYSIGQAIARYVKQSADGSCRIVIGKDTRVSGAMLEEALHEGICSAGVNVLLAGVIPTPGVAFLVKDIGADAGVVISASHNPYQDNGIKVFSSAGTKLLDEAEAQIESFIGNSDTSSVQGDVEVLEDAVDRYGAFCRSVFPNDLTLDGVKIVLDCSNGAAYEVAPQVMRGLGAEVIVLNDNPDGQNINDGCGSEHVAGLCEKVLEKGADIGLAFDGDADRLIAVDEKGQVLTGDHILAICGRMYKDSGMLKNNIIISTVMSNYGLSLSLKGLDVDRSECDVGDKQVFEMMVAEGAVIGGEASGHMIFMDCHTTGDGLVAGIQLLKALLMADIKLSELAGILTLLPQKLENIDVESKPPLEGLEGLQDAIKRANDELGGKGRVLIRYSGTQLLCRVMVEGPTIEMTERLVAELSEVIKTQI